jgi:hypothetical protein
MKFSAKIQFVFLISYANYIHWTKHEAFHDIIITERRGQAINTPASYSAGPGFKSRPGFSVVSSVPPGKCRDSTLN